MLRRAMTSSIVRCNVRYASKIRPLCMRDVHRHERRGEPRAERRQDRSSLEAFGQRPLQSKEHRRRRHVAEVARDRALDAERVRRHVERRFDRFENLLVRRLRSSERRAQLVRSRATTSG